MQTNHVRRALLTALMLFSALISPRAGIGQSAGKVEMSEISGDRTAPRRHFRLVNPAKLTPRQASEIYAIVRPALQGGYSRAAGPIVSGYQNWRRMNTAPYLSATHGNHYLNNYVNEIGAATYARFEAAGILPVGTIIAKDSFSMTSTGEILLGGLFLMEKMRPGFSDLTGDWKYTYIQADGTLFGETNGTRSERVEYCIACHLAAKHRDHLWFLPKAYRIPADN